MAGSPLPLSLQTFAPLRLLSVPIIAQTAPPAYSLLLTPFPPAYTDVAARLLLVFGAHVGEVLKASYTQKSRISAFASDATRS